MPKYRIDVKCRRKYIYASGITEVERILSLRPFYYLEVSVTECTSLLPSTVNIEDDITNPLFE